jgi:hypothetical protein
MAANAILAGVGAAATAGAALAAVRPRSFELGRLLLLLLLEHC